MTATYDKIVDIDRLSLFLQNLQQSSGGSGETVLYDNVTLVPSSKYPAMAIVGMEPAKTYRFEFCGYGYSSEVENDVNPIKSSVTVYLEAAGIHTDTFSDTSLLVPYHDYNAGTDKFARVYIEGYTESVSVWASASNLYLRRIVKID